MLYIKNRSQTTLIITKSKFICTLIPVNNVDEALNELKEIRETYKDATHNCYAYLIGDNYEIQKCSDDGEPQKTAGFPMLDALKKSNVTNILAVVTRYFGGTLLGASGLIKAYSNSVFNAIENVTLYQKELCLEFIIPCDYKEYNKITKLSYLNVIDISYQSEVIIKAIINKNDKNQLIKDLDNILKANLNINFKEVISLKEIKKIL